MYKQRRQSGLKSGGRGFGSTKFRFFQANFREISNFSGNFRKSSLFKSKFSKNFDCSRQILEKFRFLEANVRKILIFSGKFSKNLIFFKFRFSGNFKKRFDFRGENGSFAGSSGQIIPFLFKSQNFRTYFLYMIKYIIIFHDPPTTTHDPSVTTQNLGSRTPNLP